MLRIYLERDYVLLLNWFRWNLKAAGLRNKRIGCVFTE